MIPTKEEHFYRVQLDSIGCIDTTHKEEDKVVFILPNKKSYEAIKLSDKEVAIKDSEGFHIFQGTFEEAIEMLKKEIENE